MSENLQILTFFKNSDWDLIRGKYEQYKDVSETISSLEQHLKTVGSREFLNINIKISEIEETSKMALNYSKIAKFLKEMSVCIHLKTTLITKNPDNTIVSKPTNSYLININKFKAKTSQLENQLINNNKEKITMESEKLQNLKALKFENEFFKKCQ